MTLRVYLIARLALYHLILAHPMDKDPWKIKMKQEILSNLLSLVRFPRTKTRRPCSKQMKEQSSNTLRKIHLIWYSTKLIRRETCSYIATILNQVWVKILSKKKLTSLKQHLCRPNNTPRKQTLLLSHMIPLHRSKSLKNSKIYNRF